MQNISYKKNLAYVIGVALGEARVSRSEGERREAKVRIDSDSSLKYR